MFFREVREGKYVAYSDGSFSVVSLKTKFQNNDTIVECLLKLTPDAFRGK